MSRPATVPHDPRTAGWLAPAAFLLLGLIWGSSFLWIKVAVAEIPPATLVAYRMTLGAVAMLVFLHFIGQRLPRNARQLAPLAVMGMINAAIPIFLISWAELYVDSGTAAVLNSLVPIFSLIVAGVMLRAEPVTAVRVVGLLLGFGGATILASREFALRDDPSVLLGCAAVILAAASYALGASYARHGISTTHRYVVAAGTLVFAAIYMWASALTFEGFIVPKELATLVAIGWLGLLGAFVAYLLFFYLIERVGATSATMTTYLFPVVGVILGVVFLGETLDLRLSAGTVLVVVGIVVVRFRSHEYGAVLDRIRRW